MGSPVESSSHTTTTVNEDYVQFDSILEQKELPEFNSLSNRVELPNTMKAGLVSALLVKTDET